MRIPTIEIIVSTNGSTRMTTHGYAGTSCQEATRELERALGLVTQEQKTAEYFVRQPTQDRIPSTQ